jgi:acyl-CoA dehydrogenase
MLTINEEQKLLKASVRDFLTSRSPVAALRKLRDDKSPEGIDRQLWTGMCEMGLSGLTITEVYGGLDFGYLGLGQLLEETGRTLTASPLISTVLLATTAIDLTGNEAQKKSLLPKLAQGQLIIALAHEELTHHHPSHVATTAKLQDNGYVLNGHKTFVMDGHIADKIMVVARTEGNVDEPKGIALFLVDADTKGLVVQRTHMLDSRNAAKISMEDVLVPEDHLFERGNYETLVKIYDIGCIGMAAEMLGTAQECFERTLAYLKERRQFGVPIGSFQALQHRAAKMFIDIELSKSVVIKALQAIDNNAPDLSEMASLAKAKLGETVKLVSNEAIQMHGGIGMTDDAELGFFLKRASVAQQILGDGPYHLDRYARLRGF